MTDVCTESNMPGPVATSSPDTASSPVTTLSPAGKKVTKGTFVTTGDVATSKAGRRNGSVETNGGDLLEGSSVLGKRKMPEPEVIKPADPPSATPYFNEVLCSLHQALDASYPIATTSELCVEARTWWGEGALLGLLYRHVRVLHTLHDLLFKLEERLEEARGTMNVDALCRFFGAGRGTFGALVILRRVKEEGSMSEWFSRAVEEVSKDLCKGDLLQRLSIGGGDDQAAFLIAVRVHGPESLSAQESGVGAEELDELEQAQGLIWRTLELSQSRCTREDMEVRLRHRCSHARRLLLDAMSLWPLRRQLKCLMVRVTEEVAVCLPDLEEEVTNLGGPWVASQMAHMLVVSARYGEVAAQCQWKDQALTLTDRKGRLEFQVRVGNRYRHVLPENRDRLVWVLRSDGFPVRLLRVKMDDLQSVFAVLMLDTDASQLCGPVTPRTVLVENRLARIASFLMNQEFIPREQPLMRLLSPFQQKGHIGKVAFDLTRKLARVKMVTASVPEDHTDGQVLLLDSGKYLSLPGRKQFVDRLGELLFQLVQHDCPFSTLFLEHMKVFTVMECHVKDFGVFVDSLWKLNLRVQKLQAALMSLETGGHVGSRVRRELPVVDGSGVVRRLVVHGKEKVVIRRGHGATHKKVTALVSVKSGKRAGRKVSKPKVAEEPNREGKEASEDSIERKDQDASEDSAEVEGPAEEKEEEKEEAERKGKEEREEDTLQRRPSLSATCSMTATEEDCGLYRTETDMGMGSEKTNTSATLGSRMSGVVTPVAPSGAMTPIRRSRRLAERQGSESHAESHTATSATLKTDVDEDFESGSEEEEDEGEDSDTPYECPEGDNEEEEEEGCDDEGGVDAIRVRGTCLSSKRSRVSLTDEERVKRLEAKKQTKRMRLDELKNAYWRELGKFKDHFITWAGEVDAQYLINLQEYFMVWGASERNFGLMFSSYLPYAVTIGDTEPAPEFQPDFADPSTKENCSIAMELWRQFIVFALSISHRILMEGPSAITGRNAQVARESQLLVGYTTVEERLMKQTELFVEAHDVSTVAKYLPGAPPGTVAFADSTAPIFRFEPGKSEVVRPGESRVLGDSETDAVPEPSWRGEDRDWESSASRVVPHSIQMTTYGQQLHVPQEEVVVHAQAKEPPAPVPRSVKKQVPSKQFLQVDQSGRPQVTSGDVEMEGVEEDGPDAADVSKDKAEFVEPPRKQVQVWSVGQGSFGSRRSGSAGGGMQFSDPLERSSSGSEPGGSGGAGSGGMGWNLHAPSSSGRRFFVSGGSQPISLGSVGMGSVASNNSYYEATTLDMVFDDMPSTMDIPTYETVPHSPFPGPPSGFDVNMEEVGLQERDFVGETMGEPATGLFSSSGLSPSFSTGSMPTFSLGSGIAPSSGSVPRDVLSSDIGLLHVDEVPEDMLYRRGSGMSLGASSWQWSRDLAVATGEEGELLTSYSNNIDLEFLRGLSSASGHSEKRRRVEPDAMTENEVSIDEGGQEEEQVDEEEGTAREHVQAKGAPSVRNVGLPKTVKKRGRPRKKMSEAEILSRKARDAHVSMRPWVGESHRPRVEVLEVEVMSRQNELRLPRDKDGQLLIQGLPETQFKNIAVECMRSIPATQAPLVGVIRPLEVYNFRSHLFQAFLANGGGSQGRSQDPVVIACLNVTFPTLKLIKGLSQELGLGRNGSLTSSRKARVCEDLNFETGGVDKPLDLSNAKEVHLTKIHVPFLEVGNRDDDDVPKISRNTNTDLRQVAMSYLMAEAARVAVLIMFGNHISKSMSENLMSHLLAAMMSEMKGPVLELALRDRAALYRTTERSDYTRISNPLWTPPSSSIPKPRPEVKSTTETAALVHTVEMSRHLFGIKPRTLSKVEPRLSATTERQGRSTSNTTPRRVSSRRKTAPRRR